MILERFSKHLTAIEYPSTKTSWNIAGILKGQNAFYKFDVRDMFHLPNGNLAQKNNTSSKADKMVLETNDQWVILDLDELNKYVKKHRLKKINLNKLTTELEWNIFIKK